MYFIKVNTFTLLCVLIDRATNATATPTAQKVHIYVSTLAIVIVIVAIIYYFLAAFLYFLA